MAFIFSAIVITIFPSVRAWIEDGTNGVRAYKKHKEYNKKGPKE